jgi:hypothetical protein
VVNGVSGYVFFACTFYATSYAFTVMVGRWGWGELVSYCLLKRVVIGCEEEKKNRRIKTFEEMEK